MTSGDQPLGEGVWKGGKWEELPQELASRHTSLEVDYRSLWAGLGGASQETLGAGQLGGVVWEILTIPDSPDEVCIGLFLLRETFYQHIQNTGFSPAQSLQQLLRRLAIRPGNA